MQQVIVDARTTLAQGLHAIHVAELADNAGWELLIEIARHVGVEDAARHFEKALEQEQEHLRMVRGWLRAHALRNGHAVDEASTRDDGASSTDLY